VLQTAPGWRERPLDGERLPLLLSLSASFLAIALAGQYLLDAEFLAGLQVEGVAFDFTDDVLLNNLPLESAEKV
jgi:hypothetical protein